MIVKLFTLPDKSQVEKKVQELETILLALQKSSVFFFFLINFFFNESIGHRAELKLSRHLPDACLRLLPTFADVFGKKIRMRASFPKILANCRDVCIQKEQHFDDF